MANLAHALGKLKACGDKWSSLWEAVARTLLRRCAAFNTKDLANTAGGFAKAGHAAPALLDAIAAAAAPRVREFNPQELAKTTWAYASVGHAAPALLDVIAAEAALRVSEFNPLELATTAWAYATAGHAAPALLDAIAAEAAPRVREFCPQSLANTAGPYAAANSPTDGSGLFCEQFARRCEEEATELKIKNLRRFHQWALWHAGERGRSEGRLAMLFWSGAAPRLATRRGGHPRCSGTLACYWHRSGCV